MRCTNVPFHLHMIRVAPGVLIYVLLLCGFGPRALSSGALTRRATVFSANPDRSPYLPVLTQASAPGRRGSDDDQLAT